MRRGQGRGVGREDARGMRLPLAVIVVLLPCLLGKFMWRAFAGARRRRRGAFPPEHPGICQKRDRKEKKKKKGDREWERQGPLTNE